MKIHFKFTTEKFSSSKDIIQSEENISVCFCHPRKKYPIINANFPVDITLHPKNEDFPMHGFIRLVSFI